MQIRTDWLFSLLLIISCTLNSETNNITYSDLAAKELTISKIEDTYFLHLFTNRHISAKLTGENIMDLNNFTTIDRVKTYTTVKIAF
jgi:hypothetical protein